jgi:SAM-dependent methyltransferase
LGSWRIPSCSVCGGETFTARPLLWPQLIADWQLSADEVGYIDMQQGCSCNVCGASLRTVALGDALRQALGTDLTLQAVVLRPEAARLRILDLNGAAAISPVLARLPNYVRSDYPAVDMHALPFGDGSFDVVIHSDTLEHVAQPVRALEECRRVLSPGGCLCFTVPVIVGRMTRSRAGLAKSFHGDPSDTRDDFVVHTEFGADMWCFVMQAGFTRLGINSVGYPAATAITAWRERLRQSQ